MDFTNCVTLQLCLVLAKFAEYSPYSSLVTTVAAGVALIHFAGAIVAYILHGLARDTDNQFRPPHGLAGCAVPRPVFHGFMWGLVVSEFAGAGLLYWGFLQTQVFAA